MNQPPNRKASAKRVRRFDCHSVLGHLKARHPGCPESVRSEIANRVVGREWDCRLGQAVGISLQHYVRHELTDYDELYRVRGITKEEARLIIKNEVNDIIAQWAAPPIASDAKDGCQPTQGAANS